MILKPLRRLASAATPIFPWVHFAQNSSLTHLSLKSQLSLTSLTFPCQREPPSPWFQPLLDLAVTSL